MLLLNITDNLGFTLDHFHGDVGTVGVAPKLPLVLPATLEPPWSQRALRSATAALWAVLDV